MRKKSKFLIIAIPLAMILFGLTVYEYGYLGVESQIAATKEASYEKKKILRKYLTLIAAKPRIEKQFAALQEMRVAENKKLVEGQTPSIAAGTLQDIAKDVLTARGGTISSERIEKPEDLGRYKIITVAVDVVLPDIHSLSDVLFALEMQTPTLVVRELDATIRNFQTPKELMIRLKLSALTGGR
jgi:hypothetical protein